MKQVALVLLALVCSMGMFAQDDDDFRTIFDGDDFHISGFGGPFMTFTTIDGEFAHMMGGGGGVMLGDFFFGGYGLGLTNQVLHKTQDNMAIDFSHGGFWTGYTFMGKKAIHPHIQTLIGWGDISISEINNVGPDPDNNGDNVFVLSPSLELEMNMTRFMRISVGASYRTVFGVNTNGYSKNDFDGLGAFLAFKFGWF